MLRSMDDKRLLKNESYRVSHCSSHTCHIRHEYFAEEMRLKNAAMLSAKLNPKMETKYHYEYAVHQAFPGLAENIIGCYGIEEEKIKRSVQEHILI